jgi:opacity protein-like surface antigen
MKKHLLLSVLLAGMMATPAYAAPYISGSVGVGFPADSDVTYSNGVVDKGGQTLKVGVPFGGAIGIKNDAYRVEAAIGYQTHKVDTWLHAPDLSDDSVSLFTYMVNGYYDVDIKDSSITPYVTAGLGGASITAKNEGYADHSTTVFAWQVGAGIGLKASSNLTVDLGYRYLKPSSSFSDSFGTYTFSSSNVLAGIRYEFN